MLFLKLQSVQTRYCCKVRGKILSWLSVIIRDLAPPMCLSRTRTVCPTYTAVSMSGGARLPR
eukprot:1185035-Prorocentrum_minimum.AAC.4